MKRFIRVALLLFISSISISSAYFHTSTEMGLCPEGSPIRYWTTNIFFDANGVPISAYGFCCDGTVWSRNLLLTGGTGGTSGQPAVAAHITEVEANFVTVTADQAVDIRLIDIRTGNYIGSSQSITTPNAPYSMSIPSLPTGSYGIAVSQNGTIVNLLPFTY